MGAGREHPHLERFQRAGFFFTRPFRRRLVPFNRRLRLLRRQAAVLDDLAQRGPVFDLAGDGATQRPGRLAGLLHQGGREFDG